MTFGGGSLARIWQRWFGRRRNERKAPLLRLGVARRSLGPSWHPAKGPGGRPQMQVLIELEASNVGDRDIRIVRAGLKDHRAEQSSVTVGRLDDDCSRHHALVPAHGAARITVMLFLEPKPYRAGEVFADVVSLLDDEDREHRLKVAVRGR